MLQTEDESRDGKWAQVMYVHMFVCVSVPELANLGGK